MPIADSDPRVFFAAERTLLAWLRTGLTIIALGFVVSRFGLFVRLLTMQTQGSTTVAHSPWSAGLGVAFAIVGALSIVVQPFSIGNFLATLPQSDLPPDRTFALGLSPGGAGQTPAICCSLNLDADGRTKAHSEDAPEFRHCVCRVSGNAHRLCIELRRSATVRCLPSPTVWPRGMTERSSFCGRDLSLAGTSEKRRRRAQAYLWGMYVTPANRKQGVGCQLVAEALSLARSQLNVRQVTLGVNAENGAAIALYARMGFKPFGREPAFMLVDGITQDEMQMVCMLPAP
jgi:putative membrane protein